MNRHWSSLCVTVCLAIPPSAFAYDEVVTFAQNNGSISAHLSGLIRYCDPDLGYFVNDPTASITGTSINIASPVQPGECNGIPIPPPAPVPYSYSISLGSLADGLYMVDWQFVYQGFDFGPPPPLPHSHYASFTVESGELAVFKDGFGDSSISATESDL